jgi:hypothetical protein
MNSNKLTIAALGTALIAGMLSSSSIDKDGKILNRKTSGIFFAISLISIGVFYFSIFKPKQA